MRVWTASLLLVLICVSAAWAAPDGRPVVSNVTSGSAQGGGAMGVGPGSPALSAAAQHQPVSTGVIVYSTGFDSGAGPEWSARITDTTPIGVRRFLGQFGNESVSLSLNSLPPHTQVTISFDLFVIRTWDGNNGYYGPDVWELNTDAGANLLRTTFSNCAVPDCNQAFPDSYPGGDHPAYSSAAESKTLGYYCEGEAYGIHDAVYHICVTVPDSRNSIRFIFRKLQGGDGGGISDESWGLDNVNVRTTTPTVTSYETGFFAADNGVQESWQRKDTYGLGGQCFGLKYTITDLPEDSFGRIRYQRPDGSVAGDFSGGGDNPYYGWYWAWSWWWVYLDVPGQWHILQDCNGQTIVSAPFTVVNNWSPWMRNVTARQRVNQPGVVDIDYDGTDPDTNLLKVSLLLSNDGGAHYSITPTSVSGDIGPGVQQGTGRHIVWSAKTDLPGASGTYIARVCANDGTSVVWTYSQPFAVDATAPPPAPVPSTAVSPYPSESSATLLRGQLHCHSNPDNNCLGDPISEADIAALYRAKGYDFLACTNHNWVSGESVGWQGWAPNSCEITHGGPGTDVPDGHVLAVGTNGGTRFEDIDSGSTWPYRAVGIVDRINKTHAHGGLAFVAHPNARLLGTIPVYNVPVATLAEVIRLGSPEAIAIHSVGSNAYTLWGEVMDRLGYPVWAYVEDDYHPDILSNDNLARTWVAVPGEPGEWWGSIKEKLRTGNYYCYWTSGAEWPSAVPPPKMAVSWTAGEGGRPRIDVELSDVQADAANWLAFVGRDGNWLASQPNPGNSTHSYQCTGREGWVRVLAKLSILSIASQPVRIWKTGAYAPYSALAVHALSTSPELTLTYLGPSEIPVPPPGGYIGDAVGVTTGDGTLPPNATLELSYDGNDTSAIGGTRYLAIYRYDTGTSQWVKAGGNVDPGTATIESPITALGKYCISADLPPDATAPQVWIDNPASGATINQDTALRATVNDDLGAWRVSFYMNDHLLAEDASSVDGWSANLRFPDYCEGDYALKAVAEDLAGNTGTAEIPIHIHSSTPPPTVSIATPSTGSTVTGTVTATGTCRDDVAVESVTLKLGETVVGYADVNGSNWTCDVDTTYLADGNRTLTATVEDGPGNTASASVQITVNNGEATSPIGNAKSLPEGQTARFADGVVVAGTDLVDGGFYVESENRSSGILVLTGQKVNAGDIVSVVGSATALGTEKAVQGYDVFVTSSGNDLPKPIGMYGNRLLWPAPDSIGKRVKIWGSVTSVDPSNPARWFVVSDHSAVNMKCTVPLGVTVPTTGLVAVTGVCSIDPASGGPVVIVSSASDIQALP